MTFCDNLLKSFSENLKQLTKINDLFVKNYLQNMNSACKNFEYLLNF